MNLKDLEDLKETDSLIDAIFRLTMERLSF